MDILEEINSVVVSAEELRSIFTEYEEWVEEGKTGPDAGLFLIAFRYKGDWKRAFAVTVRIGALLRLVESKKGKGWTLPKLSNGAIPTKHEVLVAAAIQPLSKAGNDFLFEQSSFFSRVLELSETEGSG